MSKRPPGLSKSRVLAGEQCSLRLWFDCFDPGLRASPDASLQRRLDRGTQIGELARERHPSGVLISASYLETELALEQTANALSDPSVTAIFEAAFRHEGVLVRVDVLERLHDRRWQLAEVKSGTHARDVHVRDVAVQTWVARGAGLEVSRAGLLLIDRNYVYDGHRLDVNDLFRFEDVTEKASAQEEEIAELTRSLHAVLARGKAPDIAPGEHCSEPYECPYLPHCGSHVEWPEHPVTDLPRIHRPKVARLADLGVEEIAQIPDDFPLNPQHKRIRRCVRQGIDWASSSLLQTLADVVHPIYHLDFEAFSSPIPRHAGCHPYDSIPFQYSVHVEGNGGAELEHREYLHTQASDPRRDLAKRLIADLGERGSICTYSSYEARVIRQLALDVPELARSLHALLPRLWDLLPVVRDHYYHPDLHGSFSVKSVLPVLVPGMSYEGLAINDGLMAADLYEQVLEVEDDERARVFQHLREYCAQDTLAMVELRRALRERATRPTA